MKRTKRTKKLYTGYIITNTATEKQYIGITSKTIKDRLKTHIQDSKHTQSTDKNHLHTAIIKYGIKNFIIKSIEKIDTWENACEWEMKNIKKFNTKVPHGYNLTDGGKGCLGLKRTKESNKKLSENKKEYYKNIENRQAASKKSKQIWEDPELRKSAKIRSTQLWENKEYREQTTRANKKRWNNPELREKHKKNVRAATAENKKWMEVNTKNNKKMAKDPAWRKKVSDGLKRACKDPKVIQRKSESTKKYWDQGHSSRRKENAKIMSIHQKKRLKDPKYQKWRLENPPGGKPILYRNKYFRTVTEAMRFFDIGRDRIITDILKQVPGCKKLDVDKKDTFNYEVKY